MSIVDSETFDRETILDMVVNFVPMVILTVFFIVYMVVFRPVDVSVIVGLALIGLIFVCLGILTYEIGKRI